MTETEGKDISWLLPDDDEEKQVITCQKCGKSYPVMQAMENFICPYCSEISRAFGIKELRETMQNKECEFGYSAKDIETLIGALEKQKAAFEEMLGKKLEPGEEKSYKRRLGRTVETLQMYQGENPKKIISDLDFLFSYVRELKREGLNSRDMVKKIMKEKENLRLIFIKHPMLLSKQDWGRLLLLQFYTIAREEQGDKGNKSKGKKKAIEGEAVESNYPEGWEDIELNLDKGIMSKKR